MYKLLNKKNGVLINYENNVMLYGGIKMDEGKTLKLWNRNFFLLWQGQLVSYLGDIIYMIALDFWVLEVTESTALMGLLSAVALIPRLILGPFAGVLVDRLNRRNIIVITDFIRGILCTFAGIAALNGFIQVWMVFVIAIVNSMCSAFFNPCITSVKPDIVPKDKIVKANSITSFAESGASMVGNSIAGILYVSIGAPYMFLFNGVSYLFSAFTEIFIKVPAVKREVEQRNVTLKSDFIEGFKFLWKFKALRNIFIVSSFINFLCNAAFILLLPYFKEMNFLGAEKYGIAMAMSSLGMVIGSGILSLISIKNSQKFRVSTTAMIVMSSLWLIMPLVNNFYVIATALLIAQMCNMISNTIFNSTMMITIPQEKRGKVFSLISTFSMGLSPLGIALGGIMGEFISIKIAMLMFFAMTFIGALSIPMLKGFKTMISFNPEEQTLEELIALTNGEINNISMEIN